MDKNTRKPGLSAPGIVAILMLLGFLGWAVWYGVKSWSGLEGVRISPLGWLFMILGAVVTFLVGAGLMALVFYSSRHDRDI